MAKREGTPTERAEREDLRLALKLPARSSRANRQVASAYQAIKKVLRSSASASQKLSPSPARSARQRGVSAGKLSKSSGLASGRAGELQRVAVRWTYSKSKGDGQWGAHGRYIERESAQDREQELGQDETKQIDDHTKERNLDEQPREPSPSRRALRFAYLASFGEPPEAKRIDGLRTLSRVGLVFGSRGRQGLLPGDAPGLVEQRGAEGTGLLRRGSDGEPGTGSERGSRAGLKAQKGVHGFGSEGPAMPISKTLSRWQDAGDKHIFKIIVSPEFGDKTDLRKLTAEFVSQMEADLGTKLQWVAIDHHNTDDPHVHLAVRGVDDRGRVLEVSPDYIKEGSRNRAREAATRQLGYRTQRDIAAARERQVVQQRFTDLDRMLIKRAGADRLVSFDGPVPASQEQREYRLALIRRVAQLQEMGLAQKVSPKEWRISENMETALRQRQIANDRLKAKARARDVISDPAARLTMTELDAAGKRVTGRLVGTGLNEASGKPYVLLEGIDGRLHFVNQPPAVQKLRASGELRVGDIVTMEARPWTDSKGNSRMTVAVNVHGPVVERTLLDQEIRLGSVSLSGLNSSEDTFAAQFKRSAAERIASLAAAGAIEVKDGAVHVTSPTRWDEVHFSDKGSIVEPLVESSLIGKVVDKGIASLAVSSSGVIKQVPSELLAASGLTPRAAAVGDHLAVLPSATGVRVTVLRAQELEKLVADERINRLDAVIRAFPASELGEVTKLAAAREVIWRERGVDLQSERFALQANGWRRNQEYRREASERGVEVVALEIAKRRGKDLVPMPAEEGRQITGRVALVAAGQSGQTEVLIDAGASMALLKVPAGQAVTVTEGARVRAKPEEVEQGNGQRRVMTWRFADLEREEAKQKGMARGKF